MFAVSVVIMANIVQNIDQDIGAYVSYSETEQAFLYALSGEELARQVLIQDAKDSPGVDHLNEDWAKEAIHYSMENGYFEIEINDLQGRFNLNNLVDSSGQRDGNSVAALKDLFQLLKVDSDISSKIPPQLADWLMKGRGGKQTTDSDYESLDKPYRPANAKITHVSEIRMLLDMEKEYYKEIKQLAWSYLTVLPEQTKVNVNTVSAEVLASLHSQVGLPSSEAATAKAKEKETGFRAVGDFLSEIASNTLTADELTVESHYFEVKVRAKFGEHYAFLTSVLHRDAQSGNLELLSRDRSQRVIFDSAEDYRAPVVDDDRDVNL